MVQGIFLREVHTTTTNTILEIPMPKHSMEAHHKGEQKCLGNLSFAMFKRGGTLG